VQLASVHPATTKADLAVLIVVLDHIDESGTAWPGQTTIAKLAAVDARTAARSINRLDELRFLERDSGWANRKANRYRMGPSATGVDAGSTTGTDVSSTTGKPVQSLPTSPSKSLPAPVSVDPKDQEHPKNQEHPEEREQNNSEPLGSADYIWQIGLPFLLKSGVPRERAATILGKLRKDVGDDEAKRIITRAIQQRVSEPLAWISKASANTRERKSGSAARSFAKTTYEGTPSNELPERYRD